MPAIGRRDLIRRLKVKQLWLVYGQETLREMWLFLYVRIFMS